MRNKPFAMTLGLLLVIAGTAFAAGLSPWEFGMSQSKVMSFSEFGHYKTFSNGDVETFNGIYDGEKQNIQFFFGPKGLRRIGVYLYEGKDLEAARAIWWKAYDSLKKKYGKMEIPGITVKPGSDPADSEPLSIAAAANVNAGGKTQMAPAVQPENIFIFSSFLSHEIQGTRFYLVIINFDSRP